MKRKEQAVVGALNAAIRRRPIMHEVNNDDRAGWAETALEAFMGETGTDREDALADLLCDLMHWADREQACHFDSELYRARTHYEAEVQEEQDHDEVD